MATFAAPSEEDRRAEQRVLSGDALDFGNGECPYCGLKQRERLAFMSSSEPAMTQVNFPCGHGLRGGVAHIYLLRAFPPKPRCTCSCHEECGR